MKRPFFMFCCGVVISLITLLFTATCSYAATVKLESAYTENDILYINGSIDSIGAASQLTLTVTPLVGGAYDLDNIVYIGQQEISETLFSLEFPLSLNDGYYVARIGGSDISKPRFIIINHRGSAYELVGDGEQNAVFGDVDQNGIIEASDALLALQYVLTPDKIKLSALQLYAANVENDNKITASSAAWILSKTLNETIKFPAEY